MKRKATVFTMVTFGGTRGVHGLVFRGAQPPGQPKSGTASALLGWEKEHGKAPYKESLHFCWFMPQRGALGVSSPVFLMFLSSQETNKKIQVPLNTIYWAKIRELLVNSSFLLLFNPAPHWLQEAETSPFCKRSAKTRPLVSSGCFCTSEAKGKLFHWSEQHQAHSHLQHWSALKYN